MILLITFWASASSTTTSIFTFGEKIDGVSAHAVGFRVPLLTAEAANFGDGHPLHAQGVEGVFHFLELEVTDDGFDLLHGCIPHETVWSVQVADHTDHASSQEPRSTWRARSRSAIFARILGPVFRAGVSCLGRRRPPVTARRRRIGYIPRQFGVSRGAAPSAAM